MSKELLKKILLAAGAFVSVIATDCKCCSTDSVDINTLRQYSEMDEELNRIYNAFWHSNSSGDREALQKEADRVKDEIETFRKWKRDGSGALPISCGDMKIGKMSLNILTKRVFDSKKLNEVGNVAIFGSENSEFLLILQSGWGCDYLYHIAEKINEEKQMDDSPKVVVLSGADIIMACREVSRSVNVSFIPTYVGHTTESNRGLSELYNMELTIDNESNLTRFPSAETLRQFLEGLHKYCEYIKEYVEEAPQRGTGDLDKGLSCPPLKLFKFLEYLILRLDENSTKKMIRFILTVLDKKSMAGVKFYGIEEFSEEDIKEIITWIRYSLHTEAQVVVLSKLGNKWEINGNNVSFSLGQGKIFYSLYNPCLSSCMKLRWVDSKDENRTKFIFCKSDKSTKTDHRNIERPSKIISLRQTNSKDNTQVYLWDYSTGTLCGLHQK